MPAAVSWTVAQYNSGDASLELVAGDGADDNVVVVFHWFIGVVIVMRSEISRVGRLGWCCFIAHSIWDCELCMDIHGFI